MLECYDYTAGLELRASLGFGIRVGSCGEELWKWLRTEEPFGHRNRGVDDDGRSIVVRRIMDDSM
jgi:hypothetical protein